jgi:hypothetical protein
MGCAAASTPATRDVAQTTSSSQPEVAPVDAGVADADDAWTGTGCLPIASSSAFEIKNVALAGTAAIELDHRTIAPRNRKDQCYIALKQHLCFDVHVEGEAEDASTKRIDVAALHVNGDCAGATGALFFRGSLTAPLRTNRQQEWTVDVARSAVRTAQWDVVIGETPDKVTTAEEVKTALTSCLRVSTTATTSSVTLDLPLNAAGQPVDVRRKSGTVLSHDVERCVLDSAFAQARFAAGAPRHVALPVAFTRTLVPLPPVAE